MKPFFILLLTSHLLASVILFTAGSVDFSRVIFLWGLIPAMIFQSESFGYIAGTIIFFGSFTALSPKLAERTKTKISVTLLIWILISYIALFSLIRTMSI